MIAVAYCRFSTDKQRETSIDDQARVCRAKAAELQMDIVTLHADNGISGRSPVIQRPGGRTLLADALAGRFEVLFVEGLDRLSRDSVEQEQIVRRLEHRGLRIVGCSDGYDTNAGKSRMLTRGLRGLINEAYLDDLREKTHRGLDGQLQRGFHAGGLSFGYRSVAEEHGHRLEVVREQAEIVRQIFEHYVQGWSTRRIAYDLNERGIRSARGGTWGASAIHGRAGRGAGVLNNELYIGRYVWNRSQWVKDPDTGRRQRMDRPVGEWRVIERPELRIVSQVQWEAAQKRARAPRQLGGGVGAGPKPRTLFGGLLRCSCCGGPMIAVDAYRYGCATAKERGPTVCHGVVAPRRAVDDRLLSAARELLLDPERIVELQDQVRALAAAQAQESGQASTAARAGTLDREIARIVDAIAAVGISPALQERLRTAEREAEDLRRKAVHRPVTAAHMNGVMAAYRKRLMDLQGALATDPPRAREALQQIFGDITITREGDEVWAETEIRADRMVFNAVGADSSNRGCGDRI